MKVIVQPPPPPSQSAQQPSSLPRATLSTGRSLVTVESPLPPTAISGSGRNFIESPLKQILLGINARAISPRAIQALSQDLYAGGVLTWDEHVDLSFQADLHPDFSRTIGALTGEKPRPDQPRDFVKEWERRLEFERRYFPEGEQRDRALHILSVLRRIDSPTSVNA